MAKRSHDHHELPRYYLSGFAEPGTSFVWVFERGAPYRLGVKYGNNPRRTGLRKAGLRFDGYVAWHRDGRQHFEFEREFQKRERPADDSVPRDERSPVWGGATLGLLVGLVAGFFRQSYWTTVFITVAIGATLGFVVSALGWILQKFARTRQ